MEALQGIVTEMYAEEMPVSEKLMQGIYIADKYHKIVIKMYTNIENCVATDNIISNRERDHRMLSYRITL